MRPAVVSSPNLFLICNDCVFFIPEVFLTVSAVCLKWCMKFHYYNTFILFQNNSAVHNGIPSSSTVESQYFLLLDLTAHGKLIVVIKATLQLIFNRKTVK